MNIIDDKVRKNLFNYLFQCALATVILLWALLFLDVLTETVLIASLGATAFIVFAMPKSYSSSPRRLIGGYSIGITVGLLCYYLGTLFIDFSLLASVTNHSSPIFFAALAVGLSIFFMTITDTEHAPAAGISLGLVINQWSVSSLMFIIVVMIAMILVQRLLHSFLINLTSPRL
ncbi:MAG: HPP family protein [Thermoplasmatota archaeon]